MIVCHGSDSAIEKPLVSVGRENLDFGKGFYVTPIRRQAELWAGRKTRLGRNGIVSIYDFNTNDLDLACKVKRFDSYDKKWLDFVMECRNGSPEYRDYDVISGGIANDRVFNTIELFTSGLISEDEALNRLRYEKPNNQICIINQCVVDERLCFIESYEVGDAG